MSERTSVRVVLAVAILAATVLPSAAQVFRADRERSEAFDMRVVAMIPPIVVHPRATGPIVATVLHPQTVSAVRVRATVAANSPTPWTIRFKTLAGETVEQFSDASPQVVQGELWSDTIPGRGAEIEVTGAPAVTVTIDAYAHAEAQTTPQSIHGKNQLIAIGIAPPEAVRFAKPVGRLRFMTRKGQAFCSGFLVASTLFMTNNHCIATAAEAASAVVELGYDGYAATVSRHRVSRLEATDAPLDMSLLRLATRPDAAWGRLTLGRRPRTATLPLVIVQHPGGSPKHASVDDCAVSGMQLLGLGTARSDFGHKCDTEGGSSGSPVIDPVSGAVVGLHHLGFYDDDRDPVNQAVQMDGILALLETAYPGLRAEMTALP